MWCQSCCDGQQLSGGSRCEMVVACCTVYQHMLSCPSMTLHPLLRPTSRPRLANLWLPTLRGVIECNITAVAAGQRTK